MDPKKPKWSSTLAICYQKDGFAEPKENAFFAVRLGCVMLALFEAVRRTF